MDFLVLFAHTHLDFRIPELLSLAESESVPILERGDIDANVKHMLLETFSTFVASCKDAHLYTQLRLISQFYFFYQFSHAYCLSSWRHGLTPNGLLQRAF